MSGLPLYNTRAVYSWDELCLICGIGPCRVQDPPAQDLEADAYRIAVEVMEESLEWSGIGLQELSDVILDGLERTCNHIEKSVGNPNPLDPCGYSLYQHI